MVQGTAVDWSIHDPDAPLFSILSHLSSIVQTGAFEFMLEWRGVYAARSVQDGMVAQQVWRQESNPLADDKVIGYSPINTPFTAKGIRAGTIGVPLSRGAGWCGLRHGTDWEAGVVGSTVDWGYALLQHEPFAGRLYGPNGLAADEVRLWLRPTTNM